MNASDAIQDANPLLGEWLTPHGLPPFERIEAAHFAPAFDQAMREHLAELDAIAAQPAEPDFDNTAAALDRSGELLARTEAVFGNLVASVGSPELLAAARELAAPLAAHRSRVAMHAPLFRRLDALHRRRAELGLDAEQRRLVERLHLDFVRAGARLAPEAQKRHAEIAERLARLHTRFGQNVLADETSWHLALDAEGELDGLPDSLRTSMRQAALERGLAATHALTLSRSLVVPFLTFSPRRALREQAWRAWTTRGEHAGDTDNREVAREIVALRHELAGLHGHACFADYQLADTMAQRREAVQALLERVWQAALPAFAAERQAVLGAMAAAGATHELQPWDWRYHFEQARQARFDLDDAELKPYFPLQAVLAAAFDSAERLFGIRFTPQPLLSAYHPDVQPFEVRDRDGAVIGVFLLDTFARPGKRSGAWMSSLRDQHRNTGEVRPVIVNNNNVAKASGTEPALLGFDDVHTLFHELGHGLHGLLSNVRYRRLAGTRVLKDFVELPSQLFEHWADAPEVLQRHARHWQTGEPIAPALIERLKASRNFGEGYETLRYLGSAFVDLALHAHGPLGDLDVGRFEAAELARVRLPPEAGINHRLAHFQHIFAGSSYAAGYYVYLWAEVLDADAWQAFVEAGDVFDPATARRLLDCVYGAGNSLEPGEAYRRFRGRDPDPDSLLRQRGFSVSSASAAP